MSYQENQDTTDRHEMETSARGFSSASELREQIMDNIRTIYETLRHQSGNLSSSLTLRNQPPFTINILGRWDMPKSYIAFVVVDNASTLMQGSTSPSAMAALESLLMATCELLQEIWPGKMLRREQDVVKFTVGSSGLYRCRVQAHPGVVGWGAGR